MSETKLIGNSPWGKPDNQISLSVGHGAEILFVSTPSHGGYYVPQEHLWKIPTNQRLWAAKWSGSENWYEEDCCWAVVAIAFPTLFDDNARVLAQDLVRRYAQ